jgi:hypothetical protein
VGRNSPTPLALNRVYPVVSPCDASLVPESTPTVHLVLDDFGKLGRSYRETDETEADEGTIIANLLRGEYEKPVRVVAFNLEEGWVRDVSEDIARAVVEKASVEDTSIPPATRWFLDHYVADSRLVVR